jgi:pimeloyl-ACP methyl ester carboxylesterase
MATRKRNAPAVVERLVHTLSEDGYQLAGWCARPGGEQARAAVVWVHGLHLGFAEPEYCAIGRAVAERAVAFYSVETRGHGFGTWLRGPGGARLAGSAWEMFTECPADLGAWLARVRADGPAPVVLAGHGYGAAKVVFHLAERSERDVAGLVIASSGSLVRDPLDPDRLAVAESMLAEGRAQDLMPWGTRPGALQSTVSAQVYLSRARAHRDLYGFGDLPPALGRVTQPVLAWFGDGEAKSGRDPESFLETMRRNAVRCPLFETRLLRGASYLYTGSESLVARELVRWVERVCAAAALPGAAAAAVP